jgi:sulfoxide reductase heme-binding subunit YedZ
MLATAVGPHLFWITSRAAGTAALLLSSAGASVGLLMGGRFIRGKGLDLRALHESLSLATIAALVVHAVSLLGDGFLKPSVADISVPFASSYREPYMAIGIVGGWALIVLGLSYYARAKIGQQRWRVLHRFTAVAWIMGIVHSLGEGTDSGTTWFLVMTAVAVVPTVLLLAVRWLTEDEQRPAARPVAAP